jgi:hypothetical protein
MPDDSYTYKVNTTPETVVNHDEAVSGLRLHLQRADDVMLSNGVITADGVQIGLVQSMIITKNVDDPDTVRFVIGLPDLEQVTVEREISSQLMAAMRLEPDTGDSDNEQ